MPTPVDPWADQARQRRTARHMRDRHRIGRITSAIDAIAMARAALEAGNRQRANRVLKHAVHEGIEPIDLLLAAEADEAGEEE